MANLSNFDRGAARDAFSNACMISVDDILSWIKDNLQPDQVFDGRDLEAWAEANGYVQEE